MTDKTKDSILVVNTGSSSVKFQVFSSKPFLQLLAHGKISDLGSNPLFTEYALPQTIRDKGIHRYGFHGLSYEWIAHFLRSLMHGLHSIFFA